MKSFSVKELSKLAGVSIRTLHHYDKTNLLKPETRTAAGYRQYGEKELLRLQQILFFRELEFSLEDIRQLLDDPDFNTIEALQFHRIELEKKTERLFALIETIDKTVLKLKQEETMITPEELYEGFSKEQAEEYRKEAREKYGTERVEASERRIQNMTRNQWDSLKKEGEEISKSLAAVMTKDVSDPVVQALVKRHYDWIRNFDNAPIEMYRGLGSLYIADERFKKHYDVHAEGLAEFLNRAIQYYCANITNKQ